MKGFWVLHCLFCKCKNSHINFGNRSFRLYFSCVFYMSLHINLSYGTYYNYPIWYWLLMSFWDITEISLTHLVFSKLVVQAMSHTTSQLDYLLSLLGLLKDMLSICKVWMYDLWIYCSILLNIWIQILCNFKIANTDITIMNVIWYTVKLFFNPLLS